MAAQLPPLPEGYSYSAEHEWIDAPADDAAGKTVTVGITAVAADALGEVVYVDPPGEGDEVTAGEVCGEVESTKSVSDLFSPVSGTVVEVNEAVTADPGLLNSDPYEAGWIFKVQVTDTGELLDAAGYRALTKQD
ncbi:glycine cleavage system protein GcvH [Sediminivirga luteola]|jgi:glycine cleavage system H protein|uniref:Glycine cleavage system H protein n=1 Tax=Sediminivirga luteola TaxID=1774748 RepID=A0A8J2TW37_9MICO|nr:glycine cleavage system protein GcvH [Sediminivirga luteola]MCI2264436.1 glycine cleavage system protein GcvH [Sediminivirga luteola]GGA06162.1 glycine cleavage system H protein [Sediminivirga luteola]